MRLSFATFRFVLLGCCIVHLRPCILVSQQCVSRKSGYLSCFVERREVCSTSEPVLIEKYVGRFDIERYLSA
jgi:hypothetical protein